MAEPGAALIPVALAIGGNLGDRAAMLRESVRWLVAGGVLVDAVSSLYETPPWGYEEQPKFLNGAVRGRTALSPRELLKLAKQIERDMGRVETFRNAPRPVDIDIALYGNQLIDEEDLRIPHPGLAGTRLRPRPTRGGRRIVDASIHRQDYFGTPRRPWSRRRHRALPCPRSLGLYHAGDGAPTSRAGEHH